MIKSIKTAITGMALVSLLSFTALSLPASAACDATTGGASAGASCAQGTGTPSGLFTDGGVFTTVVNILLFVIGAISVIMLIVGGIRYTVSNGDSSQITTAKNTIMYAIVGLIIAFLAFAIVNWIITDLGKAA